MQTFLVLLALVTSRSIIVGMHTPWCLHVFWVTRVLHAFRARRCIFIWVSVVLREEIGTCSEFVPLKRQESLASLRDVSDRAKKWLVNKGGGKVMEMVTCY